MVILVAMLDGVPSLIEIVLAPLLGIVVVEMFHTRHNELFLFFIPFLLAVFRLVLNQRRQSAVARSLGEESRGSREIRTAASWDQGSILPLVLLEAGAVVASSPTVPAIAWMWVLLFYLTYVAMRVIARRHWKRLA
jgi:hypothetical protein